MDHHPPNDVQAQLYEANRAMFHGVVDHIYSVLPEQTDERDIAVRRAHDALMALNAAVAVTGAGVGLFG